jgi:hypothetical protein
MAQAPRDDNFVPGLIGKDDTTGGDIAIQAKTTTGAMYVHIDSSDVTQSITEYTLGTSTYTEATSKGSILAAVRNDTLATLANTDNELAPLQIDANGALYVAQIPSRHPDAFQVTITSADAQSATTVKAKTASKNIYIADLIISTDTAMNLQLQDDAGTPVVLMEQLYMPANSVFSKNFHVPLIVATNQDLDIVASAAGNISVTVTGYVV